MAMMAMMRATMLALPVRGRLTRPRREHAAEDRDITDPEDQAARRNIRLLKARTSR
jgi:hypothetical protein